MIKLNGNIIEPLIMGDGTSQIQEIDLDPNSTARMELIQWEFEHEGEIVTICQLATLLATTKPQSKIWLSVPYMPYSLYNENVKNGNYFGMYVFGHMMSSFTHAIVTTDMPAYDSFLNAYEGQLVNLSPMPFIRSAIDDYKPDLLCFASTDVYKKLQPSLEGFSHISMVRQEPHKYVVHTTELDTMAARSTRSDFDIDERAHGKRVLIINNMLNGDTIDDMMSIGKDLRASGAGNVGLFATHYLHCVVDPDEWIASINECYTRFGKFPLGKYLPNQSDGSLDYAQTHELQ